MSFANILPINRSFLFTALLLASLLLLSACQAQADPLSAATPPPATEMEEEQPAPIQPEASPTPQVEQLQEALLSIAHTPEFGEILVGNDGMTLYVFTIDGPNQSNCDQTCIALWPPLLTQGNPTLGANVDPQLVGSAESADGSLMVTYNQMPLYFWVHDNQPGDTTGQGVEGVWFVVSPQGDLIAEMGAETVQQQEQEPAGVTIMVAESTRFGEILVDGDGKTLYAFSMDGHNLSNCLADCLNLWPPLVLSGEPVLGDGVDADKIGSAELEDGRLMLTYNGMPLYYYAFDNAPGDTNGQLVGDMWFVVSPQGEVVRQEVQAQPSPTQPPSPYEDPDY
jgi:predicted lipoprotein with Yx(FWY)xxD motif